MTQHNLLDIFTVRNQVCNT